MTTDTRKRRREQPMVPEADFRSYYGLPVLIRPSWQARDIGGYLFLGGLAGASSTMAAAADLTGRPALARAGRLGAAAALTGSLYTLIHDLGRPARFLHMLRMFKVTSPMSVGTWILSGYGPQAFAAAASDLTGIAPRLGRAATLGAGLTGPLVATYTGALIANTAVPAWHGGYRELPYLFAGSAVASAAGLGVLAAPPAQAGLARDLALIGVSVELAAGELMRRRLGALAEPLRTGRGGRFLRWGKALSLAGAATALTLGRRSHLAAALGGAAVMAGAACTRFGIFHAGMDSADDPKYTVAPQRDRLDAAEAGQGQLPGEVIAIAERAQIASPSEPH